MKKPKREAPHRLQPAGARNKGAHKEAPLIQYIVPEPKKGSTDKLSTGGAWYNREEHRVEPNSEKRNPRVWFSEISATSPTWIAVSITLMYGSGFLCNYTYLDYFGVRGIAGDFFRAKFVYIGALFLLFPVCVLAPLIVALSLGRIQRKSDLKRRASRDYPAPVQLPGSRQSPTIHITSYLIFLNMGWVFYICLLFTPRGFFLSRGKEFVIPAIFLTSILAPRLIQAFIGRYIVPHKSERFSEVLSWTTFAIIVLPLDYWAFRGFFAELWSILWGTEGLVPAGAIYYFLFTSMMPYLIWRINERCKLMTNQRGKKEIRIAAVCLVLMFYFLSIHAFAVRVFPCIPVAKGGGNLTESPISTVLIREHGPGSPVQDSLYCSLAYSNCWVLVEQTPTALFLASTNDSGGPRLWRRMANLPTVVELPRDRVEMISYSGIREACN